MLLTFGFDLHLRFLHCKRSQIFKIDIQKMLIKCDAALTELKPLLQIYSINIKLK